MDITLARQRREMLSRKSKRTGSFQTPVRSPGSELWGLAGPPDDPLPEEESYFPASFAMASCAAAIARISFAAFRQCSA